MLNKEIQAHIYSLVTNFKYKLWDKLFYIFLYPQQCNAQLLMNNWPLPQKSYINT